MATTNLTGNLHCRLATMDDYDAIMTLLPSSEIDYLPSMYHGYIRGPNSNGYVAELDGQVVSFIIIMVNNGGRTINRMAGRTKPALQSRGIISVTRRYGVQHMTSLFPNIHEHVYDSINEGKVKMKLDRRDAGVKRSLVHSRRRLLIDGIDPAHLKASLHRGHLEKAREIYQHTRVRIHTYSEVSSLFDSATHFFADKRFQVCLTPWSTHPDNFPHCFAFSNTVVCSSKPSKDGAVDGISLGTGFVSPGGYTMIVEYYGRSADSAFGHFVFHAQRLAQDNRRDKLYILFAVVKPVDLTAIEKNIQQILSIPTIRQPDAWLTNETVNIKARV